MPSNNDNNNINNSYENANQKIASTSEATSQLLQGDQTGAGRSACQWNAHTNRQTRETMKADFTTISILGLIIASARFCPAPAAWVCRHPCCCCLAAPDGCISVTVAGRCSCSSRHSAESAGHFVAAIVVAVVAAAGKVGRIVAADCLA